MNIQDIISSSIRGDQKSQRELYEAFKVRWYMIALRYGKNKMQAEDILQEGLIAIFKNLHQYDHKKAAFSTWSTRVLINAGLRYLKKNSWTNTFKDIDDVYNLGDESETIYEQLSAKELTSLVQKLPTGYRLVFNMYAVEGYSHKEIAQELGIEIGTSKSQLSKARKTLRTYLENQLIKSTDE